MNHARQRDRQIVQQMRRARQPAFGPVGGVPNGTTELPPPAYPWDVATADRAKPCGHHWCTCEKKYDQPPYALPKPPEQAQAPFAVGDVIRASMRGSWLGDRELTVRSINESSGRIDCGSCFGLPGAFELVRRAGKEALPDGWTARGEDPRLGFDGPDGAFVFLTAEPHVLEGKPWYRDCIYYPSVRDAALKQNGSRP